MKIKDIEGVLPVRQYKYEFLAIEKIGEISLCLDVEKVVDLVDENVIPNMTKRERGALTKALSKADVIKLDNEK